jgi:hypothetical protein
VERAVPRLARRLAGVLLGVVVMIGAVPLPAAASRTVGISAPTFEFNVASGQTGSGELYVINDGTEPIKVMVYAANQKTDPTGKITYEVPRPGDLGNIGPAAWLRLRMPEDSKAFGNTPYVEMKPKQRVLVKFEFDVPPGIAAGDHQVILFFEMFEFSNTGGMMAQVSGRVGSRIRIRVQGTFIEKMTVQPFSVREIVIGDAMPWSFVVRNDGNLDKPVTVKLALLDSSENEVQASQVASDLPLYARTMAERSGTMLLTKAGIGRYTARLTATYPKEPDARGESVPVDIVKDRTVWVLPLWLVIVLVALVGAVALWLAWRSAVRTAERRVESGRSRGTRGRARPARRSTDASGEAEAPAAVEHSAAPDGPAPVAPSRQDLAWSDGTDEAWSDGEGS